VQDLQARLSRFCVGLAEIENELKQIARENGGQPIQICEEALLGDVKSAVDRVRHLLWPYAEAAARRTGGLDEALQKYRMQRVTTMLHDLTERVAEPRLAAMPEAQTFFSSIQEIATLAVEKHLERITQLPAKKAMPEPAPLDVEHLLA